MFTKDQILARLRDNKEALRARGAVHAALCGSRARGDAGPGSDTELSGASFDKAYIANEVAYHKTVDSALETQLIPSSSNAELKSLLQTGLKIFQGHEQHAEHVAADLK
jgi:predicted nucleotidyltransferase